MASDPNYQAYLHPILNRLFDLYHGVSGTIVLSGGPTDLFPPYRRTEAGEMAKWLRWTRAARQEAWDVVLERHSLTTVENLLNFVPKISEARDILVFCEKTRARRIHCLIREIPALHQAKVVAIDFDVSPRRYDQAATKQRERTALQLELSAIKNPHALAHVRKLAKEKLRLMRQYPPEEAHRHLSEIYAKLNAELVER